MELNVSEEITCKWQNHNFETTKYLPRALYLNWQTAEINFEKLLGWAVFKNANCNPCKSSSIWSNRAFSFYLLCYLTLLSLYWAVIFMFRSIGSISWHSSFNFSLFCMNSRIVSSRAQITKSRAISARLVIKLYGPTLSLRTFALIGFCTSVLCTQFTWQCHATSCIEWAHCWSRDI